MANDVTKDPMYLDSAGSPISTGRKVNIFKSVEWVGAEAVGDQAYMTDALGAVVCDFTCDFGGSEKDFGGNGQVFEGPFNLSKLDSGYLLIARV